MRGDNLLHAVTADFQFCATRSQKIMEKFSCITFDFFTTICASLRSFPWLVPVGQLVLRKQLTGHILGYSP